MRGIEPRAADHAKTQSNEVKKGKKGREECEYPAGELPLLGML